jgi:anti-sigma factor RsiW
MHTVLDGEATGAEARELERQLAAEPAARAEFEDLRRLFEGLSRVPQRYPPEGLVAAVLANIPQKSAPQRGRDQLLSRSRVIGTSWMKLGAQARENPQRTFRLINRRSLSGSGT